MKPHRERAKWRATHARTGHITWKSCPCLSRFSRQPRPSHLSQAPVSRRKVMSNVGEKRRKTMIQPSVAHIVYHVSTTRTDFLPRRDGNEWHDTQRAGVCHVMRVALVAP